MGKVNRIKEWLKVQMKNKKFVITTIVFLVLLVAVVFGITISFSGILGSAYDVDSIDKNIDKIKIGDSINYTANGYSDWKVLSIDKKNKTIDIISSAPTEDIEIKYSDVDNYLDILQNTANKYMDGKYAIRARSIDNNAAELEHVQDVGYWLAYKEGPSLYNSFGAYSLNGSLNGYYMPVVTLNVGDSSSFNVNDGYYYSLNGVENWTVLYVNDSTSISIVPNDPIGFEGEIANFTSYIELEVAKFKDDNVLNVRAFSREDVGILDDGRSCEVIFTGKISGIRRIENNLFDGLIEINEEYSLEELNVCGSDVWNNNYFQQSFISGFVPVVTLRYGKPEEKEVDKELNVGDYVKYSANAYDSWKVLNINKEEDYVEIVSTAGVKEITLKGKEDYNNYESILQSEVDRYKSGDIVVGARVLSTDDIESLKSIGVPLVKKNRLVFLNEKQRYIGQENSYIIYGVTAVDLSNDNASLILASAGISPLYVQPLIDDGYLSPVVAGDSSVTGQIFPVITLKLSKAEKVIEEDVAANNKKPSVHGVGSSSNTTVNEENNETNENETVVEDKEDYSDIMNEFSKLTNVISNLENDLKEEKSRSNILIVFSVLIIGLICFSFVYFARRK